MKKKTIGILSIVFLLMALLLFSHQNIYADHINGEIGVSGKWGSGWLDLSNMMNFQKGSKLRLKVGGPARKIIIRLLEKGVSPDSPSGIIGDIINVPENKLIELQLNKNYNNIIQISVHGGANPWGLYDLGPQNGSVTLLNCEYSE